MRCCKRIVGGLVLLGGVSGVAAQTVNSVGMRMLPVSAGYFYMGSSRMGEDADESPVHRVTLTQGFKMAATEVTNAQYEAFDPAHKALRGKNGFSKGDNEAVVFVNYAEAVAFCQWLSQREGKPYRLPTEAEWEYACRAGTIRDYATGNSLPAVYHKSQKTERNAVVVDLTVGQTPANSWGLQDMHGNVEEWCQDWYGPYSPGAQTNPLGPTRGIARVTRGGSHGTPLPFLRSANRLGMLPDDKNWQVGFRVVQAPPTPAPTLPPAAPPACRQQVSQRAFKWKPIQRPLFLEPISYIQTPDCRLNIPFFSHNHSPALTWCPNGDLLAVWFSTQAESGREMVILGSRLRAGQRTWDEPSEFFKVPDRNMTGSSLFCDAQGTLYFMNGVETDGDWQDLAMVLLTSRDNGASWSVPRLVSPEHRRGNQVIAGMFQSSEGWLVQAADADAGPVGGTVLYLSRDGGKTWTGATPPDQLTTFQAGGSGPLIAGIHAAVAQLGDGSLLAFGRKNDLPAPDGSGMRMPMSRSLDMGRTWTYAPSEFPPIWSGQRPILYRLREGALLLVSFTHHPDELEEQKAGMWFQRPDGKSVKGYGMYAAVSFDDGKTWPIKRLLTDGKERYLNGGAWTGAFIMDATHAETKGYLALTQTPDNLIHLLSSSVHYRFNLDWLKAGSVP